MTGSDARGPEATREAAAERVPADFPLPIVLGIDPGTRVMGYGAVVAGGREPRLLAAGTLEPPGRAAVPVRLGFLRRELDELIARLRPSVVVVEQAFSAVNAQSALRIGEGRGVVLACASVAGAEVVQYPPATAKKALVGNGAASKEQVAAMVAHVLGALEPPLPLDATDALGLALAYVLKARGPLGGGPLAAAGARRAGRRTA